MKKLALLLFFLGTALFAQSDSPKYDKNQVTVTVGSDLWTKPFSPKFTGGVTYGYKFAENYKKFFDTVYGTVAYTGNNRTDAMTYHVGVQRTMMNDRDRMGLLWKVEGGATTLYGVKDKWEPSVASGIGLGFDFSGDPYPAWMNHTVLSFVPMLNKVESRPVFWTLALSFTKTF